MPDLPIPIGFRAEILQQVVRQLRSGESCALVGVGSSGKSNIARHLLRADVRHEYFGDEATHTCVAYINCKPFAPRPPHDLYLYALDQLERSLEELPDLKRLRAEVNRLWREAESDAVLLAWRNLDRAVGEIVRAGARRVVFILDDCDDLLAQAPPMLFSDLRGLRDNYKVIVVYVTLSRREPAFLRQDTHEYEELFELLSAPGHTIPVTPYVESDALHMLRRLAARQVPEQALSEAETRRLYELGGGHAGLIRALFFATRSNPELAHSLLSPETWDRLAEFADVDAECRKIWDSLEPEEQDDLRRILRAEPATADGLRRLERRGLARPHLNRPPELFSPIFEKCLRQMFGTSAGMRLAIEFPGVGAQVRVNGDLVTSLLQPEFEILRYLASARPDPVSRLRLIEAMRLAEQSERSARVQGDPLRRLEEYIRQLKAKLGPAGQFIHPAGDGYRLVE